MGQAEDEVKRHVRVKNLKDQEATIHENRGRTAQWNIETGNCAGTPAMVIQPPSTVEKRGSYDARMMRSGRKHFQKGTDREHMLWDELRYSLVDREGSLSGCRLGGTLLGLEEIRRDRAAQEKRRGLINEAISVLLEPSSEEEDMESN